MNLELVNAVTVETAGKFHSLVLPPIVGEVFGAGLMRALGIKSATEFRVCDEQEAQQADESKWVVKSFQSEGRLRWWNRQPSAVNLLIGKIPGTISLGDLHEVYGITSRPIVFYSEGFRYPGSRANEVDCSVLWAAPQHARPKLTGFDLPEDLTALQSAVEWDSDAMLRIHAARLFLSCSAAHQSNVLVNKDAELFSIDHANCIETDSFEIKALFENIKRDTRAWKALDDVARLHGETIIKLLDGFSGFRWPLGSLWATQDYYLSRLETWQTAYYH